MSTPIRFTHMKRLLSIAVLLILVPLAPAGPKKSSVYVERNIDNSTYNAGTGTVISVEDGQSLILSAAHVVPDEGKGLTVTLKGKSYKAKYLAGSKVTEVQIKPNVYQITIDGPDLAVLIVDAELPVAKLAKEGPAKGDRLRQWGYANRQATDGPDYKEGTVETPDLLFATVDARPGDSGAALFNDDDEVAALTSARPANPEAKGVYAVPLTEIRQFLKDNAKGWQVRRPLRWQPVFLPLPKTLTRLQSVRP